VILTMVVFLGVVTLIGLFGVAVVPRLDGRALLRPQAVVAAPRTAAASRSA
jgi:hypothetical protein